VDLPRAPFEDPASTIAGERVLDAASDLFYRRGIRAVGVDLVAEVAGTTKKTLYDRFGSKDELVARYLRRRALRWEAFLLARLHEVAGPERVLAVFDALATWLGDHTRGCAFVNAHAEVGGTGHPAEAVIRAEKDWMRRIFVALAGDGRLGAEVYLLYEGAMVAHTAGGWEDAVATARAAASRVLNGDRASAGAPEPGRPPIDRVSACAAATTSAAAGRARS
jgi:AcrR family transcriptional regulator